MCRARTECSRRPGPWQWREPGFGIRDSGFVPLESRFPNHEPRSCSRSNDARAGEVIVQTAVIAGEDGRAEAESRRDREHGPHDRPQKRAAEIERAIGARANDADTG